MGALPIAAATPTVAAATAKRMVVARTCGGGQHAIKGEAVVRMAVVTEVAEQTYP
jgi:hypothetical protein